MKKNDALKIIEKLDDDQIEALHALADTGAKGQPLKSVKDLGVNTRKVGGFKRRGWAEEHKTRKGTVVRLTSIGRALAKHAA